MRSSSPPDARRAARVPAGRGGSKKRCLIQRIQFTDADHMPDSGAAVVVGYRGGLALPPRGFEAFGRGRRGRARIHHDLKPHIRRTVAVGQRSTVSHHQARDQRRTLGQEAGWRSRAGAAKGFDFVIGDFELAVELIQRHDRRGGDAGPCGYGGDEYEQKQTFFHVALYLGRLAGFDPATGLRAGKAANESEA